MALAIVLAFAVPAGAQGERPGMASIIPSGVYAHPSCDGAEEIWVVAAGLNLYASEDWVFSDDVAPEGPVLDYGWRRYGEWSEQGGLVRTARNGVIEYATPTEWRDEPEELPETAASAGEAWVISRYAPCSAVPFPFSLLHGEAAAILLALDPALESCDAGAPDCLEDIFLAFDKWPDGELRVAELSRAMRFALYLGVMTGDDPKIEALVAGTGAAVIVAPLLAMTIVASYDYDGSDSLSLEEIGAEFQGPGRAATGDRKQWSASEVIESLSKRRESLEELTPLLRLLERLKQ